LVPTDQLTNFFIFLLGAERMRRVLFRPFMESPEDQKLPEIYRILKNPLCAWVGLRPLFAQHTDAEDRALVKWARGRKTVVEIGVAEGGSALTLHEAMEDSGTLYLIDPYHLSRFRWINSPKKAAHSALKRCSRSRKRRESVSVVWIEDFSFNASKGWTESIEFLFIDGDHEEGAVRQDWDDWHRFVVPKGIVAFHDARVFPGGWPRGSDGPVRVVDALFRDKTLDGWEIVDEAHSLVFLERRR
jgi:predicted O-methyltransferase YrrM